MIRYQLLWGIYVQWTRSFATEEHAIKEARHFAASMGEPLTEFTLLRIEKVPLPRQ